MTRRTVLGLLATALTLSISACGSAGGHTSTPSSPTPPAGASVVNITNFAFSPASVTVRVGGTVEWVNHDMVPHNIKWQSAAIAQSQNLVPGTSADVYSHTFTAAGTYSYICGIHPSMSGTVIVTP